MKKFEVGTQVKVDKGSQKGRKGEVVKKRAINPLQKGKIPVMVGNRKEVIWVKDTWLEEREIFSEQKSEYMGKNREDKVEGEKCQQQLQQSDCLKESGDFVEQRNKSEDLIGSNQLKSMKMRSQSSEAILTTTSGMETSDSTAQSQEQQTCIQSDFLVSEHPTPEPEPDSITQNQHYGLKHSDASVLEDQDLLLWSSLKGLSTEDFEQFLAPSEWQDIVGTIRRSCKARKLELSKIEPDYLSSPTLTASNGVTNRPAGQTRCEKWLKKREVIPENQVLSVAGMALLSGFPPSWTDCLLELNPNKTGTDLEAVTSTEEPLSPSKQQSLLNELNTLTPLLLPGEQWIDPKLVQLKEGTQPRDCDENFAGEIGKIQQYAEDMKSGIWDFTKSPLPVAFIDSAGKIHASDCHHRVSAAIAAGIEKIYIDLRQGELVDAKLFACQANTQHGLPLRPKDQRKRIEMFLDLLETIDSERVIELLDSISNLGKLEKTNSLNFFVDGRWTARTVAKYLKLNESGYRTVQNIMLERRRAKAFADFSVDDFTRVTSSETFIS